MSLYTSTISSTMKSKKRTNKGVIRRRRRLDIKEEIRTITAFESKAEHNTQNIVSDVFSDFCSNTTLHGVKYLGSKNHGAIEKIWWALALSISIGCCGYLISCTYLKWGTSPVILSFAKQQTPIWKIPFPSVTICPSNKIGVDNYNYSHFFHRRENLTGAEKKKFWDISLICNLDSFHGIAPNDTIDFTDTESIDNIELATAKFELNVFWKYKSVNQSVLAFQLTEEGMCYTFNSFNQEDMFTNEIDSSMPYIVHNKTNDGWTLESGFPTNWQINSYPERTADDGIYSGLTVMFITDLNLLDYTCGFPVTGFKIMLHNPAETPQPNKQYILASINRQHAILVNPDLTTTSKDIYNMKPKVRKCYLSHEKILKFFKVYTQNNCKIECFANITLQTCDCVPFYVPRDAGTKICAYGKLYCVSETRNKMMIFEMDSYNHEVQLSSEEIQILEKCDCFPSCTNLQFSAETSEAALHMEKIAEQSGILDFDNDIKTSVINGRLKVTILDIFFKEREFVALHRSELFGQSDFLANIGGLLGLFLGFSVLSLIEILYFIIIRVWCKIRHNKQIKVRTIN